MKIASVAGVKARFSAYLRESEQGPVVITRNGRAVGVLLAVEDDAELERLVMAHSPRLRSILETARKRIRSGAGIPHRKFWRDIQTKRRRTARRAGA